MYSINKFKFFKEIFLHFFTGCFIGNIILYLIIGTITKSIVGFTFVFGELYRMLVYHEMYPFQYIFLVAFMYSTVASLWAIYLSHSQGWKRWVQIFLIFPITILISCPFGGILWVIHDMYIGHIPEFRFAIRDLTWGIEAGITQGPLIIYYSFPFNLISLICGLIVTNKIERNFKKRIEITQREN